MDVKSTKKSTENTRQTAPSPDSSHFKPIVEKTFSDKIQKSGEVHGRYQRAESPLDVDMSTQGDFENWLLELPDSILGEDSSSDGPSPGPDSNLSSMTSPPSSGASSPTPTQGNNGFNSPNASRRVPTPPKRLTPEQQAAMAIFCSIQ